MYTLLKKMPSQQLKMVVLLILGFSRQEYWTRLPFPSPGIFPIQGLNSGLPHCRQILYCLIHQKLLQ